MRILIPALAAIMTLSACSQEQATIHGRIEDPGSDKIYLEKVLPGGTMLSDSATVDAKGNFRLKTKTAKEPVIYYLRSGGNFATLLIAPGEKVKITASGSLSGNYTVEGSEGSQRMLELHNIMTSGMAKMDSLREVFAAAGQKDKAAISAAYAEQYYATKREQINFIVTDPASISSIYALYQRLPHESTLVDGKRDITYYRLVADSTGAKYPASPYVTALRAVIEARESQEELSAILSDKLQQDAANYPEIEMPDIYGKKHKLSDLDGKVIILDFWSTRLPDNAINNAEIKKLYGRYADRGLAVYQVCLDMTRHSWVSAVTDQKLPWISVCDLRGTMSPAAQSYNIQALPANFVIDRGGNIVGKNLFDDELEKIIKQLI